MPYRILGHTWPEDALENLVRRQRRQRAVAWLGLLVPPMELSLSCLLLLLWFGGRYADILLFYFGMAMLFLSNGLAPMWAGMVTKPKAPWGISIALDLVEIRAESVRASLSLKSVDHAVLVSDDSWERMGGFVDTLVVACEAGMLRIPACADGFDALLSALERRGCPSHRVVDV